MRHMIPSSPLAHPWQTCLSKMLFFQVTLLFVSSLQKNQPEALSEDVAKWWLVVVDFHVWWRFVFNKRSMNEDRWKFIASMGSITKKFARWIYDFVNFKSVVFLNRFTSDFCEGGHSSSKPVLCRVSPCWKCWNNLEDLLERVLHFGCVIKQFKKKNVSD